MDDRENSIAALDPSVTDAPRKAPRKPRPSELAKKAAQAAGVKPAKVAKPKAVKKAKAAKKSAAKKTVKKSAPKKAAKPTKRAKVQTARLDLRCTPAERAKVMAVAKRKKLTLTAVVMAGVAKLR